MLMLFSCGGAETANPQPGGNNTTEYSQAEINNPEENVADVEILTREIFLQYIRENDVGVTEEDFADVDIDDFLEQRAWSTTTDLSRFRIDTALENYRRYLENLPNLQREDRIFAREIRSVESTDEEFEAFVQAYFAEIGKEPAFVGSGLGIYRYDIMYGDSGNLFMERYILEIGRTMDFVHHTITINNYRGFLQMDRTYGGSGTLDWFVYSGDDKFFLISSGGSDPDFLHRLREVFTKIEVG